MYQSLFYMETDLNIIDEALKQNESEMSLCSIYNDFLLRSSRLKYPIDITTHIADYKSYDVLQLQIDTMQLLLNKFTILHKIPHDIYEECKSHLDAITAFSSKTKYDAYDNAIAEIHLQMMNLEYFSMILRYNFYEMTDDSYNSYREYDNYLDINKFEDFNKIESGLAKEVKIHKKSGKLYIMSHDCKRYYFHEYNTSKKESELDYDTVIISLRDQILEFIICHHALTTCYDNNNIEPIVNMDMNTHTYIHNYLARNEIKLI